MNTRSSVFPTEGFLDPGTQVRQFGRKLNAWDDFSCAILMSIFKKLGFQQPLKLIFFSGGGPPDPPPPGFLLDASYNSSWKITADQDKEPKLELPEGGQLESQRVEVGIMNKTSGRDIICYKVFLFSALFLRLEVTFVVNSP